MSPKEYDLLRILVQHAGKVLTHKFLLGELWDDLTDAQYLRVYVRQLRQKIEGDPERPQYVLTKQESATAFARAMWITSTAGPAASLELSLNIKSFLSAEDVVADYRVETKEQLLNELCARAGRAAQVDVQMVRGEKS